MREPAGIAALIETHVAASRLAEAVQLLRAWATQAAPTFADDATALAAEASAQRAAERRDELSADELARGRRRLASRILTLKRDMVEAAAVAPRQPAAAAPTSAALSSARPVFISYNHQDADSAAVVRQALEEAGISVLIDSQAMAPGEDIGRFVRRCIATSRATVCLVSRSSLLSGWVAQETLLALSVQALDDGAAAELAAVTAGCAPTQRAFVALFLDEDFFAPTVRLALTETIDTRLSELDALRAQHAHRKLDSVDLDAEAARLHALRHGLGAVLQRLRQTLCLELCEPARVASLARLVQHLAQAEPTRHG